MTIVEATKILRYISIAYPSYKPQYDEDMMSDALALWCDAFKDIPGSVVLGAVKSFVKNGTNKYAPSVGEIQEIIDQAVGNTETPIAEAWNMVLLAIRNGTYGADDEYAKLPEDVQEAIGGSHYLHELALSEDVNWGVEKSLFERNIKIARERRKNVDNLPNSVKEQIEQLKQNLNSGQIENKQEVARIEQKERYEELSRKAIEMMEQEEQIEMSEGAKGFADMIRERLGMK